MIGLDCQPDKFKSYLRTIKMEKYIESQGSPYECNQILTKDKIYT